MRKDFPGLMVERFPSGTMRYRVRPKGDVRKKIALTASPTDSDFREQYLLARKGISPHKAILAKALAEERRARVRSKFEPHVRKIVTRCRSRAKTNEWEFDLSVEWVAGMLENQGYKCCVSGVRFTVDPQPGAGRKPFAPSVDRIDNARGYTKDNVRLTTAIVNTALADWAWDDFLRMCCTVAKGKDPGELVAA